MRILTKKINISLLFLLFAGTLFSQTVSDAVRLSQPGLYTNARAMALGNAYSVIGNDYSAVLFNPATLGLTESTEFTGSINYDLYANASDFLGTNKEHVNNRTTFSQFGIVLQLQADSLNSFALALGYTHTKDFNRARKFDGYNQNSTIIDDMISNNKTVSRQLGLSYPVNDSNTGDYLNDETIFNGRMQQSGFDLESGGLNTWSFGLSYEFANNIYLGGSINYSIGGYLGDSEYYETDIYNNCSSQTDPEDINTVGFTGLSKRETREWAINGYDFRIGILYKLWNFIGVGVSFKTPTIYNIFENYSYSAQSNFNNSYSRVYVKEVLDKNYKISTPYELTVGAMVNMWIITAALEGTYTDYSKISYDGGLDYKDQAVVNKYLTTNFDPLFRLNGSAEFRLPFTGLSARLGAMLIMTPSHSDQLTEEGKIDFSYDKKYLNAGIGFRSGEDLEFDITYTYGWWTVINENYGEGLSTVTNDIQIHNVIFTSSFRL
jgi:hypothetical protein